MHPPVRELLDELSRSTAAQDLTAACELFTDDAIFAGTGEDEVGHGASVVDLFRATFSLGLGPTWRWDEPVVRQEGDLAWYYAEGVLELEGARPRPYRSSGVVRRQGDGWRFALWHGAEPA